MMRVDPISLTALILLAIMLGFITLDHMPDTSPPAAPQGLQVSP